MDYSFRYTDEDDFGQYNPDHCEALRFASYIFVKRITKEEKDKLGNPIIDHYVRVAEKAQGMVEDMGVQSYQLSSLFYIVGMLHEVTEKYSRYEPSVYALFGKTVGDAVFELTCHKNDPYMDYIGWLSNNPIACVVKMAEISDNLSLVRLWKDCPVDLYAQAYVKFYKRLREEREKVCIAQ